MICWLVLKFEISYRVIIILKDFLSIRYIFAW
jgi:hypothetical protein